MSASFRDLRVGPEAMTLAAPVYKSTAGFPRSEVYGLAQQMRRAAVSVPSNIAEGKATASIGSSFIFCYRLAARFGNCRRKSRLQKNYNIFLKRAGANC
jgi:23S rRNA-intervening sequence protein